MAEEIIKIELNQQQKKAVKRKLKKLSSPAWMKKPIRISGQYMLGSIADNFKEEGRPLKWVPLTPRYKKWKTKVEGKLSKILTLTGRYEPRFSRLKSKSGKGKKRVYSKQLQNSISVPKTTVKGFIINAGGTNAKYAGVHQFGKGKIPARPFIMFQEQDVVAIKLIFTKELKIYIERSA